MDRSMMAISFRVALLRPLAALLAAAGLVTVTACGPANAPAEDGARTLTLGLVLEPPGLDPTAGAAAAIDEVVYANLFEGLVRVREDGSVAPSLASSWTTAPDGLTWTFSLREGVRFHDGTTFDAEDVRFSLDRARAPDSLNAQRELFAAIGAVEAVDPRTVRLVLTRPDPDLLFTLGQGDAVIVAPESAATNATAPVGTGPFRFGAWARGASITLERFEGYAGAPVGLDRVVFRFIADPSAAANAIRAGDVDGFPDFPAPELLPALERDPDLRVTCGETEGETIVAINHRRAPLGDVRVRRALSHAIDRQAVIAGAMAGFGTPIGSHFSPAHPDHLDLTGRWPHDPARARALLQEAGVPAGQRLRLVLPPPGYARRGGEIIAAQLEDVGLDIEIVPIEWAPWLDQVFGRADFDLTVVSHTEPRDIAIYARPDYYFGYRSAAFDEIIARLSRATDPAERRQLNQLAQTRLADEAAAVFLFQLPKLGVWNRRVQGQWTSSPIQANDVTGVTLVP